MQIRGINADSSFVGVNGDGHVYMYNRTLPLISQNQIGNGVMDIEEHQDENMSRIEF